MKIKKIKDLSDDYSYKISEKLLTDFGYHTEYDSLDNTDFAGIFQKTYKKISSDLNNSPTIITYLNGLILSKIWMSNCKIDRQDGGPAEILYDENGIIERNWYISGRCINNEIAFICMKKKIKKKDVQIEDIAYIKSFFNIK